VIRSLRSLLPIESRNGLQLFGESDECLVSDLIQESNHAMTLIMMWFTNPESRVVSPAHSLVNRWVGDTWSIMHSAFFEVPVAKPE